MRLLWSPGVGEDPLGVSKQGKSVRMQCLSLVFLWSWFGLVWSGFALVCSGLGLVSFWNHVVAGHRSHFLPHI